MSAVIAVIWNPSKTEKGVLESALAATVGRRAARETVWFETTEDDPGQGAAARALAAGVELIAVAGGDGTVRAVAEHLAENSAEVDLAIIPLGTGNLLARNLDVPLGDVPAAFARAVRGEPRPVDVGWVEVALDGTTARHAFVVMVGFGIDAQMIAETDDDLKAKAGWLAYVESLGRAVSNSDVLSFHITRDGEPASDEEGHTLLIANCGSIQGGITLLADADPSDGELDYLVVSADSVGQWAETAKTMLWDNGLKKLFTKADETVSTETIGYGRAKTIEVTLPEPRAFQIDGEHMGETRGFTVTVQPSAIRVR